MHELREVGLGDLSLLLLLIVHMEYFSVLINKILYYLLGFDRQLRFVFDKILCIWIFLFGKLIAFTPSSFIQRTDSGL